jgi:hypothetical protein
MLYEYKKARFEFVKHKSYFSELIRVGKTTTIFPGNPVVIVYESQLTSPTQPEQISRSPEVWVHYES